MGIKAKNTLRIFVIALLASLLLTAVGVLFSWNPHGWFLRFLWLLVAVYVFHKQEKSSFIWIHSVWLFALHFGASYFATVGRFNSQELAISTLLKPTMLILHMINYLLYVSTGYVTFLWMKKK
jgi:hypothetical protein